MFDMFGERKEMNEQTPEKSELVPPTPEEIPAAGGAETQNDMPQVPDMNLTPDMSPVSITPDMSPVSSMDTSVPTTDTSVAEPAENTSSDTVSMPAEESTTPSIGEMTVNTVTPETNTPPESSEKAKSLVHQRLQNIDEELSNYDSLERDFEDLRMIVDKNNNNRPLLLKEKATLQKIAEGLGNGDQDTLDMAETFIRLGEAASAQPTNTESQPTENSDSREPQATDIQAA